MKYQTAKYFAFYGESDEKSPIVLRMRLENKKSKYFVSLDRKDYSLYPEEQEILLQSGLKALVESVETVEDKSGTLTIMSLCIKDEMVEKEHKKRTLYFAMPVILISIQQLFSFPVLLFTITQSLANGELE